MSHSSGKQSKACVHRMGESLRNTHVADCLECAPWTPCTESLEGSGMFQENKTCNAQCRMDRSVFTVHRSLYWWEKYGIVRWEKKVLS